MFRGRLLRPTVIALTAVGALGVGVLSAPAADATTATNCSTGLVSAGVGVPSPVVLGCSNFTPAGSPYVFTIATLTVLSNTSGGIIYRGPDVATCADYDYYEGALRGLNCSFDPII